MTIDQSANNLLEGGSGAPVLKFPTIGDMHKGTVVSASSYHVRDFTTKEPRFWKDGKPIVELLVTLKTDQIDEDAPDGVRRLFCTYRMRLAIQEALKQAGTRLETGGTLAVKYTGDVRTDNGTTAHEYVAQYRPPAPTTAANDLLGTTTTLTSSSNVSSATWAADGGVSQPVSDGEPFDPFTDR